jgi:hypothetical protein
MQIGDLFRGEKGVTTESPLTTLDEFFNKITEYFKAITEENKAREEYFKYVYKEMGQDEERIKSLLTRWNKLIQERCNKGYEIENLRQNNPWLRTVERYLYQIMDVVSEAKKTEEREVSISDKLRRSLDNQVNFILANLQRELRAPRSRFNEEEINVIIAKVKHTAEVAAAVQM